MNSEMPNYQQTPISEPTGPSDSALSSDASLRVQVGRAPDTATIPAYSSIQFDGDHDNDVLDYHRLHRHCDYLHEPYAALGLFSFPWEGERRNASILSNPCVTPEATGELQDDTLLDRNEGPITQPPTSPPVETNPFYSRYTVSPVEPRPPRVPFMDLANYNDQWMLSPELSALGWRYLATPPPTHDDPQQSQTRFRELSSRFGAYAPIAYLDVDANGVSCWRFPPAEELIRILDPDPAKRPPRRMPKDASKCDDEELFWFGDAVYTRSDAEAIL